MLVGEAKEIAREWVLAEADSFPSFAGAFFHGSANWLADGEVLPPTSDLDVLIVLDGPEPERKPGKFRQCGVLLEVSFLPVAEVQSAEHVLGLSHLAGSFRRSGIIADPTGQLARVQAVVAREYAQRQWVRRRCEDVVAKLRRNLRALDATPPFHDAVSAWLFGTGLTTHLPLVAALRNPTVRRRYADARDVLAEYGQAALYPTLLDLLGCAEWDRARATRHLDALVGAFDAAAAAIRSPFFFAADLRDDGRAVAIDGSRELIARGDHRESVFWIVATYARCQQVLDRDAPRDLYNRYDGGFRALLGDLSIASHDDLLRRGAAVETAIPEVQGVAEAIMAANPAIEG